MTRVVKPPSFSIWNTLIAFSIAACLLQSQASAQSQSALSLLKQYQGELARVSEVAGKRLAASTIYLVCRSKSGYEMRRGFTVGLPKTRWSILYPLFGAQQNVKSFSASFAPAQAWIDRLPEFSRQFNVNADIVLGVQQDIKAGNGPTDQQRQTVAQALKNLTGILDAGSEPLRQGTSALATFLQRYSEDRQKITQAIAGFDRSAHPELEGLSPYSYMLPNSQWECTPDLKNAFESQVRDIKRDVLDAAQNLETSSKPAERAVAELLGFVVSNQTDIKSVRDMVNAAKADQLGGFLQGLHLDAAKIRLAALATGVQ
jgi:hypothetical protein